MSYSDYEYADYSASSEYFDLRNEDPSGYKFGGYHPAQPGDLYNSRYLFAKKLGWGHFSTVWLAVDKSKPEGHKNRCVAVKINKSNPRHTDSAMIELKHLEKVRSKDVHSEENVVCLLDVFDIIGENGRHICLVFELLGNNLLTETITREKALKSESGSPRGRPLFSISLLRQYTRNILEGLAFLHEECGLIHTDIKPENLSLTLTSSEKSKITQFSENFSKEDANSQKEDSNSQNGYPLGPESPGRSKTSDATPKHPAQTGEEDVKNLVKIVDLGNSVEAAKANDSEITTRQYRAPEVILGMRFTAAADVWAVACVVFELATGDFLFKPKAHKRNKYSKDEDHLAMMMEMTGCKSLRFSRKYKRGRELTTSSGKLRRIRVTECWSVLGILQSKYKFEREEARGIAEFLSPMLEMNPKNRTSVRAALEHPWLREKHTSVPRYVSGKDSSRRKELEAVRERERKIKEKSAKAEGFVLGQLFKGGAKILRKGSELLG